MPNERGLDDGVKVWREQPLLASACQDCEYREAETGALTRDNVRERAKAHARKTGHAVRVVREFVIYFNPKGQP